MLCWHLGVPATVCIEGVRGTLVLDVLKYKYKGINKKKTYCRIKHNHLVSCTALNSNTCEPVKGIPKWNASIPKQHKLDVLSLRTSTFTSTS